jgi:hypothetical protein
VRTYLNPRPRQLNIPLLILHQIHKVIVRLEIPIALLEFMRRGMGSPVRAGPGRGILIGEIAGDVFGDDCDFETLFCEGNGGGEADDTGTEICEKCQRSSRCG